MSKRLLLLATLGLSAVSLGGCALPFGPELKRRVLDEIGHVLQTRAHATGVEWSRWPAIYADHRDAIAAATSPEAFAGTVNEALAEFGVSHLALGTPAAAVRRSIGMARGPGFLVLPDGADWIVTRVVEGSMAHEVGLRAGAELLACTPQQGERYLVQWRSAGLSMSAEGTLREYRTVSRDVAEWIAEDVLWVRVHSFGRELYDPERVEEFFTRASAASGLVLDLRSNRGGYSEHVRHLASMILPAFTPLQTVSYRSSIDGEREATPDRRSSPRRFAGPLVVLVDGWTASGAEVLAAAVQDANRGAVVGGATRRNARVSDHVELVGDYLLQVPVGEIRRPGGAILEVGGVKPDVSLSVRDTADDAIAMTRAIELLRGQKR